MSMAVMHAGFCVHRALSEIAVQSAFAEAVGGAGSQRKAPGAVAQCLSCDYCPHDNCGTLQQTLSSRSQRGNFILPESHVCRGGEVTDSHVFISGTMRIVSSPVKVTESGAAF